MQNTNFSDAVHAANNSEEYGIYIILNFFPVLEILILLTYVYSDSIHNTKN